MFKLFSNTKIMGTLVLGAALIGVAYYYFGSPSTGPIVGVAEPVASQDLLVTLSNLRTMRLDASLLDDPLFASLSDFGVVIPPEPIGRRNPFAPLGSGQ